MTPKRIERKHRSEFQLPNESERVSSVSGFWMFSNSLSVSGGRFANEVCRGILLSLKGKGLSPSKRLQWLEGDLTTSATLLVARLGSLNWLVSRSPRLPHCSRCFLLRLSTQSKKTIFPQRGGRVYARTAKQPPTPSTTEESSCPRVLCCPPSFTASGIHPPLLLSKGIQIFTKSPPLLHAAHGLCGEVDSNQRPWISLRQKRLILSRALQLWVQAQSGIQPAAKARVPGGL